MTHRYFDPEILDTLPGVFTIKPVIDSSVYAVKNADGSDPQAVVKVSSETARSSLQAMTLLYDNEDFLVATVLEKEAIAQGLNYNKASINELTKISKRFHTPFKTWDFKISLSANDQEIPVHFSLTAPSVHAAVYALLTVSRPDYINRVASSFMPEVTDEDDDDNE